MNVIWLLLLVLLAVLVALMGAAIVAYIVFITWDALHQRAKRKRAQR